MIFEIFSPKNLSKKLAFFTQNKAKFWKNLIITLVFEKNANFFAENCPKSQKIVIITLTTGPNLTTVNYNSGVVKIYNTTNGLVRFGKKLYLLLWKNALAYYNAGVVAENFKVVGLENMPKCQ
jgi:hypothetical protein